MQKNQNLKELLHRGKNIVGTWCEIPSPEVINILAKAGMDFVIIDMEHGAMDFDLAAKMVMAAEVDNCAPLIRVSQNDESEILRAFETGVHGVIIPHIESKKDSIKAVGFSKYAPIGNRSLNPYTRAGGYHSYRGFTKEQNEKTLIGLVVEGKEGIKNIEHIIADKIIDLIYIGTYDISAMLGIPGETKNPLVFDTLKNLVKKIRNKNKAAGCLFHDEEEAKVFQRIGIQFLCYKVDTSIIFDEIQNTVTKIKKHDKSF